MLGTTVITLGATAIIMSAAEALVSNSSSTHSSTPSSITTTSTSLGSLSSNAAALLSTTYETEWSGGEYNPYGPDAWGFPNSAPPSLASYCSSLFEAASSAFLSTVALTSQTVPPSTITVTPFTLTETEPSTTFYDTETSATTELVGERVYVYNQVPFTYSPSSPCCLNCTLFGGTVQVYHWPTSAPSPPVTELVNAAKFTFTSPSIYVAFQSLHATDLCGQVGKKYNSTTLAFHPGELSTAAEYFIGTPYYITDASNHSTLTTDVFIPPSESFTKADFATVTDCADITTVSLYADTSFLFDPALGGDGTMTVTMTYNLCSPKVSMPTELFTINSLWTGCLKGIDGFFDPPYTLTQGNGLSAFSAADQTTARPPYEVSSQSNGLSPFSTTPTLTASAGPTPAPVTPVKTTADPTSAAPASSPSPDPPASTPSDDILAPTPTMPNEPPVQSPTSASDPGGQSPTPEADSLTLSATPANGPPPKSSTDSSVPADPPTDPEVSTPAPSPVVIASQTLAPGSQITHSSTTYSLASNGATLLIAGSQGITTQILATPTTPSPSSFIVVGAQTVFAGSSAIVLSGTTYSLASNGATLLIAGSQGTSTQILATPAPSPSSYVVIGTNTISAGSSAITVSGTTYSLAPSNNVLVVDGTSQYLIGSQTLVPGGAAITVSGTVASLLPGGSSVVIGGSTLGLTALTGSGPITTSEVEYIIGSQTLSAGGVATLSISGSAVQVSLLAGGSSVVIGGTTTMPAGILISEGAKSTEVPVTETSVGGIIASIGGFLTSSSTSQTSPSSTTAGFNGATFTGSGSLAYRKEGFWVAWWGLLFGIGVFGVMWL